MVWGLTLGKREILRIVTASWFMSQLSLCIDDDTLSKIETASKISKTTISKWVLERLKESLVNNWPENYGSLFGAVDVDTITIEKHKIYSECSR